MNLTEAIVVGLGLELLMDVVLAIQCPSSIRDQCFRAYANISLTQDVIPIYDNKTLSWICSRAYLQVDQCLVTHREACANEPSPSDAKEAAIRYLCMEGKSGYVENVACYDGSVLREEIAACSQKYHTDTESVMHIAASFNVKRSKLCQYQLELLDCMKSRTIVQCGHAGGDWVYNFNYNLLSYSLEKLQCPTGNSYEAAAIWGITGGCVAAVISLIVITLWCKKRFEQQQRLQNGYRKSNNSKFSAASTFRKSSGVSGPACETTYVTESPTHAAKQPMVKQSSAANIDNDRDTADDKQLDETDTALIVQTDKTPAEIIQDG